MFFVMMFWPCDCSEESGDAMWLDGLGLTESERLVNRLRNANPERFRTMVKMHLSFYLELPGTGLDELINDHAAPGAAAPADVKSRGLFSGFVKAKRPKGKPPRSPLSDFLRAVTSAQSEQLLSALSVTTETHLLSENVTCAFEGQNYLVNLWF